MTTLNNVISGKQQVEIREYITAVDFTGIVKIISNSCFKENEYHAEYYEIIRRYVLLKYFTDIKVAEKDMNRIFEKTQQGTWFIAIEEKIVSLPVWKAVEVAVEKQIAYTIQTRETAFDKLCNSLTKNIPDKDTMAEIKQIANRLNDVSDEQIIQTVVSHSDEVIENEQSQRSDK